MTNFQDIYQHSYPVSPDGNPFVQNDLGRYTQNHPVPPDDCVFTTEGSARTAMIAVYGLLDLDRDIPPIWPTQYDIRSLLASAKTLNNGRLPGSWLLSKLLKNTYYEDILP